MTSVQTFWTKFQSLWLLLKAQKVAKKMDSPHKVSAHRAEGGLPEEGGDELVVLDEVDLGLLDGSSPTVQGGSLLLLLQKLLAVYKVHQTR